MVKKRIYELAKELDKSSKELVDQAKSMGLDVKSHMSGLEGSDLVKLESAFKKTTSTKSSRTKVTEKKADTVKNAADKTVEKPIKKASVKTDSEKEVNSDSEEPKKKKPRFRSSKTGKTVTKYQNDTNISKSYDSNESDDKTTNIRNSKPSNTNFSNNRKPKNFNSALENAKSTINKVEKNGSTTSRPDSNTYRKKTSPDTTKNSTNNGYSKSNTADRSKSSFSKPTSNGPSKESLIQITKAAPESGGDNRKGGNNKKQQNRNFGPGKPTPFNKNKKKLKKAKKNGRLREVEPPKVTERKERPLPEVLEYNNGMNVADIAKKIHRETAEIIKKLFMLGVMVNQNQALDSDTIEILAADYGIGAQIKEEVDIADIDKIFDQEESNKENLVPRPPVVTIMGHVDHGKTTLLDKLRNSNITAGEAGGITQGIGAYHLDHNGKMITFLDTPGHEAFTEMRSRGANITDLTILVVAADDGVMPQTIEAIDHAKAAKVPLIVAVNKIDKQGANPNHVMEQLAEHELIPESWGGDTIFVEISAKTGQNLDELLDMINLQAEVLELKANPNQNAVGSVIEAELDPGKGSVANILVQQGTMHVGDPIVIGNTFGRIRTMIDEHGKNIKKATPSTPVEITGLNDVPEAGDRFVVFDDEKSARAAGEERAKRALVKERERNSHVTLDNLFDSIKEGEMKRLDVIIKADVQGSAQALSSSLKKIDVNGVRVNIIHEAVGAINESDVSLATAGNSIIIGFNVRPTAQAKVLAQSEEVDIRLHRVIYNAIDEIEAAMKGMLEPVYEEEVTGQVEVRETYNVSKIGTIAGGYVTEGLITRDSKVRLIRDGIVIHEGELGSLRRFKDDVKEVKNGYDLGLTIDNYNDIKIGDVVEAYHMKEVPVK